MNAMVLSIGDELVLGQTVDTNSAWLSGELASIGWDVAGHLTVGDDQSAIESAIAQAAGRCDVLLVTGGLGPTKDDLTRAALARMLAVPLEMNADWLGRMEEMFRQRGRPMADANRAQALIPRGARMIQNSAGTAAGIDADFTPPDSSRRCRIFAMPGVPREMRIMFQHHVFPFLCTMSGGRVILTRTLHTFGLGESNVGEMLGDLMDRARNPSVGTTVFGGVVSLRIASRQKSRDQAEEALRKTVADCRRALGDLIYGVDELTLPSVIGDLLTQGASGRQSLRIRRVATAESCTGGLLAKMLTDVPGSSRYFQRGWIAYSNDAKTEMLDVDAGLIAREGAVSEGVVAAMADAARRKSAADFGLAISGIAGPDGGTATKPVGTVCIALAHPSGGIARTFSFPGDRETVRDRSAKMALTMLRYHLLGKKMPF
jgi:competence/damage-inducible protein CinA-like protein